MDKLDIKTDQNNEFPIIGIACCAACLESLKTLVGSLTETTGSFIIFQDLSQPQQKNLSEMLQQTAILPVQEIVNTAEMKPGYIYVVPENNFLILNQGTLSLKRFTREEKPSESLDQFFGALAEKFGNDAIGLLLNYPTGEGAWGLKKIRAKGGATIAVADLTVLPVSDVTDTTFDYYIRPTHTADLLATIRAAKLAVQDQSTEAQQAYEDIIRLAAIKSRTTLERFNPEILKRKIAKRMVLTRQKSLVGYLRMLKDSPSEQDLLFYEILNSPTFFFNSTAFDVLGNIAFSALLENSSGKELRLWSPGCRSGEEVYSLAIVLHEYLQSSGHNNLSFKIFATDISLKNIKKARTGIYSQQDIKYVDQVRMEKYFIKKDSKWQVGRIIRDCCVFAVHDITKDFPLSGIDLISCRNALPLFSTELRLQLAATFHYALNPGGFLLIAEEDSIPQSEDLFQATEIKGLYIGKNTYGRIQTRDLLNSAVAITEHQSATSIKHESVDADTKDFRKITAELLAEQYAPAAVLINEHFEIVHFNGDTSPFLQPPAGTPNFNILNMAHHEVRPILKKAILDARSEKRSQQQNAVLSIGHSTYTASFEVVYLPMHSELLLVVFSRKPILNSDETLKDSIKAEIPPHHTNSKELTRKQELYFEELQTTNEELLQRTQELELLNEELKTTAEELRSNNEELSCTNDELKDRRNELSALQQLHASIIKNLKEPLIILDQNLIVQSANPAFYRSFGIQDGIIEGLSIFDGANSQWISPEFKELVLQRINRKEMVQDTRIPLASGPTLRTYMVNAMAIENELQQCVMLTFRDITDSEEAKKELSFQRQQQLERSTQLEHFTASATDKLLDPVRKIHMFAKKIVDTEKSLTQGSIHSLERILNTSHNLERLIEDLVIYLRVHFEQKKPKKTDLNQILRKVLNELKSPIRQTSAIIESEELPLMPVIPCQIRLLFAHLISNTLRFANEASAPMLKITLHHIKDISHEISGAYPENEYIKLSFTDNGRGFEQNYETLVFDPFYQLHRSEKNYGSGLGLALVRQIALNHHGMAKVSSSLGQGTTVSIYLPVTVSFEEQCSPN